MDPQRFETLLKLFKALADENRLKILGLVGEQPCSVEELSDKLNLKPATVSHHLNRLKAEGLVKMEREQNTHYYRLEMSPLHRLQQELTQLDQIASPEAEANASWEAKVLGRFIQEGQLVKIPGSRKKREVILRFLVEAFERDRSYPEREVNAILGAYHEDVATLRRELVGYKLLQREKQCYWRP